MHEGARDGSLNFLIRSATKNDLEDLTRLENLVYKEETFSSKQVNYLLLKAKSMVLVSISGDKLVGSMIILLRKHIRNARIYSLNVDPEYRRRGIASSLINYASTGLKEDGFENITLEVGINNSAAQALYRSKGFVFNKMLYNYYSNGDHALHLIKKL